MLKSYTTAYNQEAIVKKLEDKIEYAGRLMVEKPADKLDEIANNTAEDYIQAYIEAIELVKGGGTCVNGKQRRGERNHDDDRILFDDEK